MTASKAKSTTKKTTPKKSAAASRASSKKSAATKTKAAQKASSNPAQPHETHVETSTLAPRVSLLVYARRPLLLLAILLIASVGGAHIMSHRQHAAAIRKTVNVIPHRIYKAPTPATAPASPSVDKSIALTAQSLSPLQACDGGMTDVFVAHEDDDLLFMNPDLASKISAGQCVRSIFVTAGDDGNTSSYWQGREVGIERAYAYMASAPNNWTEDKASIYGHVVSIRHLDDHPNIGLIFLRLPDGDLQGQGFPSTSNQSLEQLANGAIPTLTAVDGSTDYSYVGLKALIGSIMQTDSPDNIFTQVASGSLTDGDHSDHRQVGLMTLDVRNVVRPETTLTAYAGYPGGHLAANLSDEETYQKREIFLVYAAEDAQICHVMPECPNESTYVDYFSRMYKEQP